jgi:SAM-dependent methyltransferase
MDFSKYYIGGREDAQWLISLVHPYCNLAHRKILDWGCGPARLLRHLPEILGPVNEYHGTDYNPKTIAWCRENIPGVTFSLNTISPPLPYSSDYFDFIYGISILTHLSEENQQLWSNELFRIISPKGIVLLTTHGDAFIEKLTPHEQNKYKRDELISREKVQEGHRMYGAFHPPSFIRNVFEQAGFSILQHTPGTRVNESFISQDVWILTKI